MIQKSFILFTTCLLFVSWDWKELSLKKSVQPKLSIQTHWVIDTVQDQGLRRSLANNSPPLITKKWVISGNSIDGVKAYNKKNGQLVWSFPILGGISKPLLLNKNSIYFGGKDGFFYSLNMETGSLKWKYYTSSELAGRPFIYKDKIYFLTQSQKLYALDTEGQLLWLYSHFIPSNSFIIRGNSSPIVIGDIVYSAFQDGSVKALKRNNADLVWKVKLSSQPIISALKRNKKCLFAPVFNSYLYCLNPLNGKVIWKIKGGSAVQMDEDPARTYQFHEDSLFAYKKNSSQLLWKKKLKKSNPFALSVFKGHLIYGFPSYGKLKIIKAKDGSFVNEYFFGRGLAGSASLDPVEGSLYFLSIDAYLHKISFF